MLAGTVRKIGTKGQCLVCGKILSNVYNAIRHYELNHTFSTASARSSCPICSKVFKRETAMKDHMRKVHKVYQKQDDVIYEDS